MSTVIRNLALKNTGADDCARFSPFGDFSVYVDYSPINCSYSVVTVSLFWHQTINDKIGIEPSWFSHNLQTTEIGPILCSHKKQTYVITNNPVKKNMKLTIAHYNIPFCSIISILGARNGELSSVSI